MRRIFNDIESFCERLINRASVRYELAFVKEG